MKNYLFIDINEFIPRATVKEYDPTAFGVVTRTRGFVEESGHFSLYLEIFAPITIYFFFLNNQYRILKYGLCLIIISALVLTFSSSGTFILSLDILVLFVLRALKKNARSSAFGIKSLLLGTSIVVFFFLFYNDIIEFYDAIVVSKVNASGSMDDRSHRINLALKLIGQNGLGDWLIGYGPAMYEVVPLYQGGGGFSATILVLYLLILLESGLVGLFLYVLFLLYVFRRLFSIKNNYPLQLALGIGYFNALLHYFTIANYWYPWIWFQIILIQFFAMRSNRLDVQNHKLLIT